MKIKPGQTVKVTAEKALQNGMVGTVVRVNYWVRFPDGSTGEYDESDIAPEQCRPGRHRFTGNVCSHCGVNFYNKAVEA